MKIIIRTFMREDYPAMVEIHTRQNIVWPEKPHTPEAWAEADRKRIPKIKYQRWVSVVDGRVVGFSSYRQGPMEFPQDSFYINIEVLPEYQQRGIGTALYNELMEGMQKFNPPALRADAFTNLPQGFTFLQKQGFYEAFRETPVHLDISTFNTSPYAGLEAKLQAEGIAIMTLRELEADPEHDRKIYDLYWEVWKDVPQEGDTSWKPDFDEWLSWGLHGPSTMQDVYFIAVDGEKYIGLRELETYSDSDTLMGGLLGVLRTYRNRGIGLALQLRGFAYAREHSYRLLKTCTAIQNLPMQTLFNKLGYIRGPEWQQCQKNLS